MDDDDDDNDDDDGGVSDNAIPSGFVFGIVRNSDTIFYLAVALKI